MPTSFQEAGALTKSRFASRLGVESNPRHFCLVSNCPPVDCPCLANHEICAEGQLETKIISFRMEQDTLFNSTALIQYRSRSMPLTFVVVVTLGKYYHRNVF